MQNAPTSQPNLPRLNLSPHIKAITFDVGGTLIQPWPSVGQIYAEAACHHTGQNFSPQLLKQRFVAAWRALEDFTHTRADWARLVDATFEGLIEPLPSQTFFPELYEHFAQPGAWRIFEDVLPTLDLLASRGLKLGVISNWDERLRPLLGHLKLQTYFDPIIISAELGFSKPSRVIFEAASEKLGLLPGAILHVGDSPPNDAEAARAAGFRALLLDRTAQDSGTECINSLHQLL